MTDPFLKAAPLLLVGAGKMGGAMLSGWLENGLAPEAVTIVDPALAASGETSPFGAVGIVADPSAIKAPPAVVVLAVKPQTMPAVLPVVAPLVGPETLVVSIAAGTTLATLEAALGAGPIVRVMPNTPAQVGRGMSCAVANARVTDAHKATVTALLDAVGESAWLDSEDQIDAVTAVSGGGPAYVFLLAEVLADAAKAAGLPDALSDRLARVTVAGSGELLRQSPLPPATLRVNVTSPGGTTAAALKVMMDDDALKAMMIKAIAAAKARSVELGG